MALEVSRQVKSDVKSELITRDFLGGCSNKIDTKELDLDLHVPSGWEKRLDLESGKVYIQRCNPATQGNDQRSIANKLSTQLQHFNTVHQSSKVNLLEQPNCSPSSYTSVCTLDKVKSALEKAERSSPSSSSLSSRKRWKCSPSPSNSSSLSIKESEDEEASPSGLSGLLVAAACPRCFLYVLISKNDPKCPKCASVVQVPEMMTKKPKFDLNL